MIITSILLNKRNVRVNNLKTIVMQVKNFTFSILILVICIFISGCNSTKINELISTPLFSISCSSSQISNWEYKLNNGERIQIKLPVLEVDGKTMPAKLSKMIAVGEPKVLVNGVTEYMFEGVFESDTTMLLQITFRVADDNSVVRFCYALKASGNQKLTKTEGKDNLEYLSYNLESLPKATDVRLSVFNEMIHSCHLTEEPIYDIDFKNSVSVVGPIIWGSNGKTTFLSAYEHDSMYPNNFLEYVLAPGRAVGLKAVKGNYYSGQPANGYETIWFEVAGINGDEEDMAKQFRDFILKYQSLNLTSRKPYIFYNTWGRQERAVWAGGKYLTTMNQDFTLKEIERAHEMGIDVYQLDAGWCDKTGDWTLNPEYFPDGFKKLKEKLEGYGMKLGVWMNPAKVAIASQTYQDNKNNLKTWNGKPKEPSLVWEMELSTDMCLVSPYWEYYANLLIRMNKEFGVSYVYWDAVGQSGCDGPGHFHGGAEVSIQERRDCYGFLLPVYLGKIMEKVCSACPDVIFDFDVTENRRIGVGLQFLANGRYFIMNNGPYFKNFDLGESLLPNNNHNIFINPGPARTWFVRSVLDYDKWIPSNLFLASYQPDDPEDSQFINLASLVLGQNSIWGEILKTSPEGTALFHDVIGKYKTIRDDVIVSSLIHTGNPGDTPEIYEKINPETGKGVVAIFTNMKGRFSYTTKNAVASEIWQNQGFNVEINENGYAKIEGEAREPMAAIIFFGVK